MTLETSIRASDLPAATRLLRAGVDVNYFGPEGLAPLMIASGLGNPQMVELLLTAGANVLAVEPRMGATALHKAALSGSPDVVGLLLDHGAFIDQQSPILGYTALMDAVVYKHKDVVRLLLKCGARTAIRNYWHETALDIARRDGLDTISRLIGARNEAKDDEVLAQVLVPAVKTGNIREVERLIATGAAVNDRVPIADSLDDDYTPLGLAAREGQADTARVLLDAGADPRQVIGLFKGTPLHEASYFGYTDIIRAMMQNTGHAGASAPEINAQGSYNGFTALHDAVWHGHLEAAQALVDAGARLDLTTHAGLTPRAMALLYGYNDLAEFLAEAERKYFDT